MNRFFSLPEVWFVKSWDARELTDFLDVAYTTHFGEIWLYNNDLQVILHQSSFNLLYRERIAKRFAHNIDAVKILVREQEADRVFGTSPDSTVVGLLRQLSELPGGEERLSTLYFAKMEDIDKPAGLNDEISRDDNWTFYTHRASLDVGSGFAVLRRSHFPFSGEEGAFSFVWSLGKSDLLQRRIRKSFEGIFRDESKFSWVKVVSRNPFSFELKSGISPETRRRRKQREGAPPVVGVLPGDRVDVAVIMALAEEAIEMRAAIKQRGIDIGRVAADDSVQHFQVGEKAVLLGAFYKQGGVPAAVFTWDIIHRWQPKFVILVGVAGGDPEEGGQEIGDVIVANQIVSYEHAKVEDGVLSRAMKTFRSGTTLERAAMNALAHWPRSFPASNGAGEIECKVIYDKSVASGYKLVADADFFKGLKRDNYHKIAATEMEGDGVGYACEEKRVEQLLVKGIMDKSDSQTREDPSRGDKKVLAARSAAHFVMDVLEELSLD